ncbi:hypothetical protein PN462_07835 [Spirulina sp. CS-785/01]|uniref:Tic22 family protein n=1 Tax=Spirulina sp. CS-785/01 TaxID=3021716 RepID=UPI00232CA8DB|nr:Tic22 family protein [Spirulina sp. CS-785/01]MDB9313008.1 hypothetical protein [Spirulina sp. CS-785/01]
MINTKSFLRWCLAAGIAGSTALGTLLGGSLSALALPAEQVVQRLQSVPVFTVIDGNGAPLVASVEEVGNVAGIFINPEDAERFVQRLKQENPELGNQVNVVPMSLSQVYQFEQQTEAQGDIEFTYVPTQSQVQLAQQLENEFQGVPLFVARGGNEGGYLTLQQNDQQRIPFFFEKAAVERMVQRFQEQQPNLADTVTIEVVPLEGIINALETNNDQQLNQIMLVPSQEAIEYVRDRQSQ